MVGDMISSNSLNSLLSTLLYILGFTLAIEGVGMAVIWFSIHDTLGMNLREELFFRLFIRYRPSVMPVFHLARRNEQSGGYAGT